MRYNGKNILNIFENKIVTTCIHVYVCLSICVCVCVCVYLPRALVRRSMRYKVNFKAEKNWFEFKVFLLLD